MVNSYRGTLGVSVPASRRFALAAHRPHQVRNTTSGIGRSIAASMQSAAHPEVPQGPYTARFERPATSLVAGRVVAERIRLPFRARSRQRVQRAEHSPAGALPNRAHGCRLPLASCLVHARPTPPVGGTPFRNCRVKRPTRSDPHLPAPVHGVALGLSAAGGSRVSLSRRAVGALYVGRMLLREALPRCCATARSHGYAPARSTVVAGGALTITDSMPLSRAAGVE